MSAPVPKKIRVLIVDDSAVIRMLLTKILGADPEFEIVGTAPDPYVARELLISLRPDVMTLDVEMPRMDGVTFLEKVMAHFPTRTIIISSLTVEGAETSLRALEAGAIDVMPKPAIDITRAMTQIRQEIITRVKAVARAKLTSVRPLFNSPSSTLKRKSIATTALPKTSHQILAIASSTGGTEAIKVVLGGLSGEIPGVVIVQHMPPIFTATFAATLQRMFPYFEVREAGHGDRVFPGRILIAPGDYHMQLARSGAQYEVRLNQDPPMHFVRPAADILLKSVAVNAGSNAIGLVLTGMGKDGAEGLKAMKEAGSYNIAQDEASCSVFGMPKEAIEIGAIDVVLPLKEIAGGILKRLKIRSAA
ncbi:MAG: chemotaxis response regulator protein-glutamate methylesterase [Bdellovibrionota bacterium]